MHPLQAVARSAPELGRPVLIAVDGVDGSGKTTFAGRLADEFARQDRPALVVHLDDFMNPRSIRYRLGRESPEGFFQDTYDLAVFDTFVVAPLGASPYSIRLRSFDYRTDRPAPSDLVDLPPNAVVIVEGMFLHRDELHALWDISVFLSVPFEISVARLAARDGTSPDPGHPSMRRYVEGQRMYLERCTPDLRATFVVPNH